MLKRRQLQIVALWCKVLADVHWVLPDFSRRPSLPSLPADFQSPSLARGRYQLLCLSQSRLLYGLQLSLSHRVPASLNYPSFNCYTWLGFYSLADPIDKVVTRTCYNLETPCLSLTSTRRNGLSSIYSIWTCDVRLDTPTSRTAKLNTFYKKKHLSYCKA